MIDYVRSELSRIVTQINDYQFIVEGYADYARFGFQTDDISLNFADINGGPFLHIGQDFFGKGQIATIEKIDTEKEGYFIFKVSLCKGS